MTCAQGLLRLLWGGGPKVGVLRDCAQLPCLALSIKKVGVENKPASSFVVSLGKTLKGICPSLCGRRVAGPRSPPVVVTQSDSRLAKRANTKLIRVNDKFLRKERTCPDEEFTLE